MHWKSRSTEMSQAGAGEMAQQVRGLLALAEGPGLTAWNCLPLQFQGGRGTFPFHGHSWLALKQVSRRRDSIFSFLSRLPSQGGPGHAATSPVGPGSRSQRSAPLTADASPVVVAALFL